jgi:hypothetical protein
MPAYEVWSLDKNNERKQRVLVRAGDPQRASCVGKFWLKVIGVKKVRRVAVNEYRPECDLTIRRYVREIPRTKGK